MSRTRAAALLLVVPVAAFAAEPDPEDPPLCREAIASHPKATALGALAEEEKRMAVEARRARREARNLMRANLGMGRAAAVRLPEYEALMARESDARRAGKSLCYCRKRREDPHREDCEILYPMVIR